MDLKGFIADHMGHFSPFDLPNILFSVVAALVLGYALARWGGGRSGSELRTLALWAAASALGVALVRSQLPLAIAFLALVLLAKGQDARPQDRVLVFGSLMLGLGCGSGATLVTLIVAIPFILLVRWAFGKPVNDR